MNYILYDDDQDGFMAALSGWMALDGEPVCLPVQRGQPLPEMPEAEKVWIVDFSYPAEVLDELAKRVELVVIDHHETARQEIGDRPYAQIDTTRAACVLAWQHFHPDQDVHWLWLYAEDYDLWKHELPGTKAVNAWMQSFDRDFHGWCSWLRWEQDNYYAAQKMVRNEGYAICRHVDRMVDRIAKKAWRAEFELHGEVVPQMRVNTPVYVSRVCAELLERNPDVDLVTAEWLTGPFYEKGRNRVSVRSRPSAKVTARILAESRGGGGHEHAAGWRF